MTASVPSTDVIEVEENISKLKDGRVTSTEEMLKAGDKTVIHVWGTVLTVVLQSAFIPLVGRGCDYPV